MELHGIVIRCVFAYLILTAMLRLSGKESVSELDGRALIVTLVISDLIDDFVLGAVPAANFIVAAGAVILTRSLVGLAAVHSERVYALVEGEAPLLMSSARLNRAAMRRERLNEKEMAEMLRTHGIGREQWHELEAVRLERSGTTSNLRHRWARALQRRDVAGEEKGRV